jgi:hypothetical protein
LELIDIGPVQPVQGLSGCASAGVVADRAEIHVTRFWRLVGDDLLDAFAMGGLVDLDHDRTRSFGELLGSSGLIAALSNDL